MTIGGPSYVTYLLDHNWRNPPVVESQFETDIGLDVDGSEQRRSLRHKPRRTMTRQGLTLDALDGARMLFHMRKSTDTRLYMPLYCDESVLTSQAVNGSGVINCDTDDRRFFEGSDILLVVWDENKQATRTQRHTISQVLPGSLDLVGTITGGTFAAGTSVYPCILADVIVQQTGNLENDSTFTFNVKTEEHIDAATLPPLVDPNTTPSDANAYKGLPILDIPHHWQSTAEGVLRPSRSTEVGLGTISTVYGDYAHFTAQLAFQQHTRAEAFRLLRFFESRAGAAFPFWYPMRARATDLIAKTSSSITIVGNVGLTKWTTENPIIALWMRDGTVLIRFVTGGSSVIGLPGSIEQHVLTLNESVPQSLDEIEKVSFATLARFSSDSISEQWRNLNVMETVVSVVGVNFSGDVTCTGNCCEGGGCQCNPEDCDDPDDPTDDDPSDDAWEPGDPSCIAGTAVLPMYYDLHNTWNSGREPIRAGDLEMPDEFLVNIKSTMTLDAAHPEYSGALSDELASVLFRPHVLEYAGTLSRTSEKSRNPYHYRITGTGPYSYGVRSGGEAISNSPYWEEQTTYLVNEGTPEEEEHTLYIRAYAEWVDQSASGGDSDYGAWGAVFVVWSWTTEIANYTDGTPYAAFDNISFTKTDPLVGGLYEGEPSSNKYAHPDALFVAVCPTTWHVPLGYQYHSLLDRTQYLHECYRQDPGAPWSDGDVNDARFNAAFGTVIGGNRLRALGMLGGWSKSEFFNWLCAENGSGSGMTILKPSRPGWDEASASLTPGSADITIDVCTPPQTGINPCEGHPDDRVGDVGGTHECWRTNNPVGDASWICVGTKETTSIHVTERCVTVTAKYDSDCVPEDIVCSSSTLTTRFSSVRAEDYDFVFGGNQDTRNIYFVQYEDDPDFDRQSWPLIECLTPGSYWDYDVGSGSEVVGGCPDDPSGSMTCTPAAGKTVSFMGSFAPPSATAPEDATVSFRVLLGPGDKVGCGCRGAASGGSIQQGYFGIADEQNQVVRIYAVTGADTVSVMAEKSCFVPSGLCTITWTSLGSEHRFSVVSDLWGDVASLEVNDCTVTGGGEPFVAALSTGELALLAVSVTDKSWNKRTAHGSIQGTGLIYAEADSFLCRGHVPGVCDTCLPEDCPGDEPFGPGCTGPCSSICKSVVGAYSVSSDDYPGTVEPHNTDVYPPNDTGPCEEGICNDCPPPFKAFSWNFSGNCGASTNPDENTSIWIGGLSEWYWEGAV